MAQFSLPGDLGTFVRTVPFDQRSIQYMKSGLGNTLGNFVGSARQNQALFNYSQPKDTTGADFLLGKTTPGMPSYQPKPESPNTPPAIAKPIDLTKQEQPEQKPEPIVPPDQHPISFDSKDILSSIQSHPSYQLAVQKHDQLVKDNDTLLKAQAQQYAEKAGVSVQQLHAKIATARIQLLRSMEQRGLAGSSFQKVGEERLGTSEALGTQKIQQGLTAQEALAEARNLSRNNRLDFTLAKNIVDAANAEFKSRQNQLDNQQKAIDAYYKSQGYQLNPTTGQYEKTAAETRAESSAHRAEVNFQNKKQKGTTPDINGTKITSILNAIQRAKLTSQGIPEGLYTAITKDILEGMSLDDIRAELRKNNAYSTKAGKPVLDIYDKVVGIAGLLAKGKFKVPKSKTGRDILVGE